MEPLEDNLTPTTITVSQPHTRSQEYNPAYEWPGDSDETLFGDDGQTTPVARPGHPTFRLLVSKSGVLTKNKRIAVLDLYNEAQIGRDLQLEGSTIPRIRLKEMAVSKLHATMYWDGARKEWNVVDMGSMHGTFLKSGPGEDSNDPGTRLSGQRAASIPRQLRHLDQLTIGSTAFVIHLHKDERPCEECSVSGRQELSISLFPPKKDLKRSREAAGLDSETVPSSSVAGQERDPKKALSMLKRSLLTRHDMSKHASTSTASIEERSEYLDRAERRRMLFPASRSDSPGVPALSSMGPMAEGSSSSSTVESVVTSAPATPLPSSNIGHKLLLRQGWTPGEALGQLSDGRDEDDDRIGLVDPLELKGSNNRSGIGVKEEDKNLNWRDREKMKRYESIR